MTKIVNEKIDWTGKWIPDKESPFERAGEYSLKQDLVKELLEVTKKYQGRIKDRTIAEAALSVVRKYDWSVK
jgi:hypothetical protein